jgi:hypothetical protein
VYGDGLVYSKTLRGADKQTIRTRLMEDDDVANEEAAAAGGVPGYCGDRYYKCAPLRERERIDQSREKAAARSTAFD